MKRIIILLVILFANNSTFAQKSQLKTAQEEIIALEKSFSELVISQDTNKIKKLQSDTYFLAVGVQGKPFHIVPRNSWLKNLKNYVVESYSIDDIQVNVYRNTAVALMLYSQKATSDGRDRSAQFVLTDIWVKKGKSWVIAERHSSRPEVPLAN
jgi:ketosteroid isomerase-like protein